jgi:hypothetical protein
LIIFFFFFNFILSCSFVHIFRDHFTSPVFRRSFKPLNPFLRPSTPRVSVHVCLDFSISRRRVSGRSCVVHVFSDRFIVCFFFRYKLLPSMCTIGHHR